MKEKNTVAERLLLWVLVLEFGWFLVFIGFGKHLDVQNNEKMWHSLYTKLQIKILFMYNSSFGHSMHVILFLGKK